MFIERVKRFSDATLDKFQQTSAEHVRLINYLKDSLKNGWNKNVVISGACGVGKTYLAFALIRATSKINSKYPNYWDSKIFFYIQARQIFEKIKQSFNQQSDYDILENEKKAPVLIIDEIGVQKASDFEKEILFEIFDYRYGNCLPTIVLSNLTPPEIAKVIGSRNADRLFGKCDFFYLTAPSGRKIYD